MDNLEKYPSLEAFLSEHAPMTEETYLAKNGYNFMGYAEPALNRQPGSTEKERHKHAKRILEESIIWDSKREELRKEYREKVERGEIIPLTRTDRLVETARVNEELEATRAARRLLAKKNIDYITYVTVKDSLIELWNKKKGAKNEETYTNSISHDE